MALGAILRVASPSMNLTGAEGVADLVVATVVAMVVGHGVVAKGKMVLVKVLEVPVDKVSFVSCRWSTSLPGPSASSTHALTGYSTRGRFSLVVPVVNFTVSGSS